MVNIEFHFWLVTIPMTKFFNVNTFIAPQARYLGMQDDLIPKIGWWFGTCFSFFHSVGNNHPN